MGFQPAKDLALEDRAKILTHGNTGSGKSELGASAHNPAIALCERQALRTIRRRNPEAAVWLIESSDDLRAMLAELMSQCAAGGCPYDTVVLDSLTEIQNMLKREILQKAGSERETLSQGEWGVIIDRCANIARAFRDLPLHVLVLCRSEESFPMDERYVRPSLSGKKLPNDIGGFFNLVGYAYKKLDNEGDLIYRILFDGTDGFLTKGDVDLDAIEYPTWPVWIRKMYGAEAPGAATDEEVKAVARSGRRALTRDGKTRAEQAAEKKSNTETDAAASV